MKHFQPEHLRQVPVLHASRIEMCDVPMLEVWVGIALGQAEIILSIVQSPKCEAGAGLLVGEEVALVVVAPGHTVVTRQHRDILWPILCHLNRKGSLKAKFLMVSTDSIVYMRPDDRCRDSPVVSCHQSWTSSTGFPRSCGTAQASQLFPYQPPEYSTFDFEEVLIKCLGGIVTWNKILIKL